MKMALKIVLCLISVVYVCRGASVDVYGSRALYPSGKVVGGEIAEDDFAPWACSLQTGGFFISHFCGCSILSSHTVISAAHCAVGVADAVPKRSVFVSVGSNNLATGGIQHLVTSTFVHPDWSGSIVKRDVALFFTETKIIFSDVVRPISLHFPVVGGGVDLVFVGWGKTSVGGSGSMVLKKLYTKSLSHQNCAKLRDESQNLWPSTIPQISQEFELCVFVGKGDGACHGDSGSPLVLPGTNQQVGIVSWGIPCALGGPDVFTRLSSFAQWILNNSQ